jgi:hypothetical protein
MMLAGLPFEIVPPRRSSIITFIAFTAAILVCIGCSNPIVVKGGEFAYLACDEAVLPLVLSHARIYTYIPNVALPVDVGSLQAHLKQLVAEGRVARVTRDTKCEILEAALYKGGRLMPKQDDVSDRAERQSGAVDIYRIRVEDGPDSGLEGWLAVDNVGFLKPVL